MVSCGAPGCTDGADKNSNTITLVRIIYFIVTILQHIQNPGIFNVRHIQNPVKYLRQGGILRTLIYSEQFIQTFLGDTQGYSAIFSHVQTY